MGSGDYTQVDTGALEIEIGGDLDTEWDRLIVNGGVKLRGTLNVNALEFRPQVGQQFMIIENDNNDLIVGTFVGLPEGEVLLAGKYEFTISYCGLDGTGTGNDVVPTAISLPPEATIAGPSEGVRGQRRAFVLTAEDSPADEAAGFTYQIDWGDGMTQMIDPAPGNGSGATVDHIDTQVGTYTVTMTAADQGGLTSDPVSWNLQITVWAIQP